MQEEINEILDKLYLNFEKVGLTAPEYSDLRDYITKLQEENESKDYTIKEFMKANKELNEQLEEYGKYRDKEVVRLNNIIDELEKYLNEELENYTIEIENKNKGKLGYTLPIKGEIKNILDKLNELKEK